MSHGRHVVRPFTEAELELIYTRAAKSNLDLAEAKARAAVGRPVSVKREAVENLKNAIAFAEEWGVTGGLAQ